MYKTSDDEIEIVRSSSGISTVTEAPDVPEIKIDNVKRDKSSRIELCECGYDQRETCSRFWARVATPIAIIIIYVFVNIKLVSDRDECERNEADNKVLATLITKGNWYIFRYKTLECPAPQVNFLVGRPSGTIVPIFVSSNLQHCSYPNPADNNCSHPLVAFNMLYTVFGMAFTGSILLCFCDCLFCLDPMRYKTDM